MGATNNAQARTASPANGAATRGRIVAADSCGISTILWLAAHDVQDVAMLKVFPARLATASFSRTMSFSCATLEKWLTERNKR
jgi:hypothetical protein